MNTVTKTALYVRVETENICPQEDVEYTWELKKILNDLNNNFSGC